MEEMTNSDWSKDLNYLDAKIRKQFATFHPELKIEFAGEIDSLKNQIPSLKNHEVICEIMRTLAVLKDGHTE